MIDDAAITQNSLRMRITNRTHLDHFTTVIGMHVFNNYSMAGRKIIKFDADVMP
jgi:hypothetical protein